MRRKGISPLIAAVLLIAFTMAIASLFAQWAPEVMQQAMGDAGDEGERLADCAEYRIDILDGSEEAENVTIQQRAGPDGIGDLTATWQYDDADPAQGYGNIDSQYGIDTIHVDDEEFTPGEEWDSISVVSDECGEVQVATEN